MSRFYFLLVFSTIICLTGTAFGQKSKEYGINELMKNFIEKPNADVIVIRRMTGGFARYYWVDEKEVFGMYEFSNDKVKVLTQYYSVTDSRLVSDFLSAKQLTNQ